MILTSPFSSRFGPGGQFLRVTQGYAPMGKWAATRYSTSHEAGNPGFSLTTGLRGLEYYDGRPRGISGIYGQGTGLDGLYSTGMGDLNFDGSGLFGTGLFGTGSWGLGEVAVLFLGVYAFSSLFGGGAQARRKEMQKARLDYEKRVAEIRDKYPRLPHPRSIFG